jgi:hypothetical protein
MLHSGHAGGTPAVPGTTDMLCLADRTAR